MREIKFKGRTIYTKEWIYGYFIKTKDGRAFIGNELYVNERNNPSTLKQTFNAVEVIPKTVGQFTNLKDENGKEIYEGDIVKWKDKTEIVEWIGGGNKDFQGFNITQVWEKGEVIGNIYENKDLLK